MNLARPLFAIFLGGLVAGATPSCIIDASLGHCSLQQGDTTCAALHPDGSLPFCSAGCLDSPHGNGCVALRPEDWCYSPCGEGLTAEHNGDCPVFEPSTGAADESSTSAGASSTSIGGETDPVDGGSSETSTLGCSDDDKCGGATPFCREGQCVSCSLTEQPSLACAEESPERPVCHEGLCVECTRDAPEACGGNVPICDPVTHACTGCTRHEQCPDSACDQAQGACLPADAVWHVDGDAGGCMSADGSVANPYCTLGVALGNVGPGQSGTLRIAALAGDAAYAESIVLGAGQVVALRGWPGQPRPRVDVMGQGAAMTLSAGAVAYLERMRIQGSIGDEAIMVTDAALYLDASVIVLNSGGGITLDESSMFARNSVIGANGSPLNPSRALDAIDSTFELTYVTMAGNAGVGSASIQCLGVSTGLVRNSIIVGTDPESIACAGITIEESAIDSIIMGEGVSVLGPFETGWFQEPAQGDFHVALGHPFDDVALWEAGDPPVDFDGDPRPMRPGAPDIAGADR